MRKLLVGALLALLFLSCIGEADAAPRRKARWVCRDAYGNAQTGCTVTVKLQSDSSLATIYTTQTGATADADSKVAVDSSGAAEWWIDSHDYPIGTVFKLYVEHTTLTPQTISNVAVDSIGYGAYTVATAQHPTIPVEIPYGVTVTATATLTYDYCPIAGDYQWLTLSGAGAVVFPAGCRVKSAWFSSLSAAATAIGSQKVILEMSPGATAVSDDLSLPSTLAVVRPQGATFTVASGKTLAIAGHYCALGNDAANDGAGTLTISGPMCLAEDNLDDLVTITDVDAAADYVPLVDATDSTAKKATVTDLFESLAGLTADTAPAGNDTVMTYDQTASTVKQVTVENIRSGNLDTITSVDPASDYLPVIDAGTTYKKATVADVIGAYTGLTTPEEYGSTGDDSADDNAAIVAALATLSSGGTLWLTKQYYSSDDIEIPYDNIIIDGPPGAQIRFANNKQLKTKTPTFTYLTMTNSIAIGDTSNDITNALSAGDMILYATRDSYTNEWDGYTQYDIAGLTAGSGCQVAITGHGLITGNFVAITAITQADWSGLNGSHTVTKVNDDAFTLDGTDCTGYAAYNAGVDGGKSLQLIRTYYTKGELFSVKSATASAVTFTEPAIIAQTYTEARTSMSDFGSATSTPIAWTPNKNIHVRGITLKTLGTGTASVGFNLRFCQGCSVENVTVNGTRYAGILVQYSTDTIIEGLKTYDGDTTGAAGLNYGIDVQVSNHTNISDTVHRKHRHGIAVGGTQAISKHVNANNIEVHESSSTSLDCHANSYGVKYNNASVDAGIACSGMGHRVSNITSADGWLSPYEGGKDQLYQGIFYRRATRLYSQNRVKDITLDNVVMYFYDHDANGFADGSSNVTWKNTRIINQKFIDTATDNATADAAQDSDARYGIKCPTGCTVQDSWVEGFPNCIYFEYGDNKVSGLTCKNTGWDSGTYNPYVVLIKREADSTSIRDLAVGFNKSGLTNSVAGEIIVGLGTGSGNPRLSIDNVYYTSDHSSDYYRATYISTWFNSTIGQSTIRNIRTPTTYGSTDGLYMDRRGVYGLVDRSYINLHATDDTEVTTFFSKGQTNNPRGVWYLNEVSNALKLRLTGSTTGQSFIIEDHTPTTRFTFGPTGIFTAHGTTDSSSTATGSIISMGGLGIAKKSYFGDDICLYDGDSNSTCFASPNLSSNLTWTFPTAYPAGTYCLNSTNAGVMSSIQYTNANTASTIVQRDASGDFSAGTITAALTGNCSGNCGTATALAADPADCAANQYANAINASGTLSCAQVGVSQLSGLGANVGTFLATPSSSNLAAAVTDETGSGYLVFDTAPVFRTSIEAPYLILGTAATAADTGIIRLPNAEYIYAESAPAGTDISVIGVDADEAIQIGASGASKVVVTPTLFVGDLVTGSTSPPVGLLGYNSLFFANDSGDSHNSFRFDGYDDTLYILADSGVGSAEATKVIFGAGSAGGGSTAGLTINGATSVNFNLAAVAESSLKSSSPTGGIGYATGAGSTVSQGTSKSTAVTINAACGTITTHNATLNAATIVSFQVTNSAMAATDVVVINHDSGGTLGAYTINASGAAAGHFHIDIRNNTAGNLGEALVLRFAIIKAVTS